MDGEIVIEEGKLDSSVGNVEQHDPKNNSSGIGSVVNSSGPKWHGGKATNEGEHPGEACRGPQTA